MSNGSGSPWTPVGRERERAHVEDAIRSVRADGLRAVVIRGEPGIGKTSLWRHGVEFARTLACDVRVARPAEEEMQFDLAGVEELFGADACAGERTVAARATALARLLETRSTDASVMLAIDDLQWLDPGSLRALRRLLAHLEADAVVVLATCRADSAASDEVALTDLVPDERVVTIDLRPVDIDTLRGVLGPIVTAISRPMLRAIHRASGGNPLHAIEMARLLPADADERAVAILAPPRTASAAVARRLDALADGRREVVDALAVAGATDVATIAGLVGRAIDADLAPLVEAGVVAVDGERIRAAHPLVASVAYGNLNAVRRRTLHRRLADATADVVQRARHLALSHDEADADVAALLEAAATTARARAAPDLAAAFLRHSLRLTPLADETARLRRAIGEFDDLAAAGEIGRAIDRADELVASLPPGPSRARAILRRAYNEGDDFESSFGLLKTALADAGTESDLRAHALSWIAWARCIFGRDLAAARAEITEATGLVGATGDRWLRAEILTTAFYLEAICGSPRPELRAEALALERPGDIEGSIWAGPRTVAAETLAWDGQIDAARSMFARVGDDLNDAGREQWRPYIQYELALLAIVAGDLDEAGSLLDAGEESACDAGDAWALGVLAFPRASWLAWRGDAAAAREAATARLAQLDGGANCLGEARVRHLLGLLSLAEGDVDGAAAELTAVTAMLDEIGYRHPACVPALPDAIEALVGCGDRARADDLLHDLAARAVSCRSAWVDAALLRARGIHAAAVRAGDSGIGDLTDAVAAFERSGFAIDAARAALALGRALRRAGRRRAAAEAFTDARARFDRIGALLFAERASEELSTVADDETQHDLTPTERRIVDLVCAGRRNREIAAQLGNSVATVEAHLTRIYRKLHVRSRAELAARITAGSA